MFVTAQDYREYQEREGARIYAWMLAENGVSANEIIESVSAMEG